jgi:hypothetical protein
MRNDLLEGLIIGATVGLAVVAIRVLLDGASAGQALALALAGVALCASQVALSRRRVRRSGQQPAVRPAMPRRLSRHNPFAQELTHNWTGLDDRLTEEKHESRTEDRG